jgi:ribosomal protein S18 acetylase RimI-like enzyme
MKIEKLSTPDEVATVQLAQLLITCVETGASVSFMHPLPPDRARAFWRGVLNDAARGGRMLLVARHDDASPIIGTVQLIVDQPENQPHRADVAKMLVHPKARRQGIGEALMHAIEAEASAAGKTVLVLDTANDVAARLYTRTGWQRVGEIPNYALLPQGGLCATSYFHKQLAKASAP